jgi:hypothetical protein
VKSRTLITHDELLAWMNTELDKADDCEGSSIDVIKPLRDLDEEGCNWSKDLSIRLGDGASLEDCLFHLRRIITAARKRFNLS